MTSSLFINPGETQLPTLAYFKLSEDMRQNPVAILGLFLDDVAFAFTKEEYNQLLVLNPMDDHSVLMQTIGTIISNMVSAKRISIEPDLASANSEDRILYVRQLPDPADLNAYMNTYLLPKYFGEEGLPGLVKVLEQEANRLAFSSVAVAGVPTGTAAVELEDSSEVALAAEYLRTFSQEERDRCLAVVHGKNARSGSRYHLWVAELNRILAEKGVERIVSQTGLKKSALFEVHAQNMGFTGDGTPVNVLAFNLEKTPFNF